MSNATFDPKAILDSYRSALAPAFKAQEEGIKAIDRVGRFQYAVAGDYLEWSLAQAKLALAAHTPADFFSKQVELTTALSEKLRSRAQEFSTLASDAQTIVTESVKDVATQVADSTIQAAEGVRKFDEPKKKRADRVA